MLQIPPVSHLKSQSLPRGYENSSENSETGNNLDFIAGKTVSNPALGEGTVAPILIENKTSLNSQLISPGCATSNSSSYSTIPLQRKGDNRNPVSGFKLEWEQSPSENRRRDFIPLSLGNSPDSFRHRSVQSDQNSHQTPSGQNTLKELSSPVVNNTSSNYYSESTLEKEGRGKISYTYSPAAGDKGADIYNRTSANCSISPVINNASTDDKEHENNNHDQDNGINNSGKNSTLELGSITNQINDIIDSLTQNYTTSNSITIKSNTASFILNNSSSEQPSPIVSQCEVNPKFVSLKNLTSSKTNSTSSSSNNIDLLDNYTTSKMNVSSFQRQNQLHIDNNNSRPTSREISPRRSPLPPPKVMCSTNPLSINLHHTQEQNYHLNTQPTQQNYNLNSQPLESSYQMHTQATTHQNSFSLASSGYHSGKAEHSPSSAQDDSSLATHREYDDTSLNFWSRPSGGKTPSASNTIDSSSNGSGNMENAMDFSGNEGNFGELMSEVNRGRGNLDNFGVGSGTNINDDDNNSSGSKDTTLSHNTISSTTNKQCCKQTVENVS